MMITTNEIVKCAAIDQAQAEVRIEQLKKLKTAYSAEIGYDLYNDYVAALRNLEAVTTLIIGGDTIGR